MKYFLLTLCFFTTLLAESQNSAFKYFKTNQISKIQIKSDFDYLQSHKYIDTSYKSKVYWKTKMKTVKIDTKVSARGRYRRRVCSFPPIKLNFSKKDLEREGIESAFDKYKLVTHCDTLPVFEGYVNREFLIYEIYKILSPYGLEVHPVELEYIYEGENNDSTKIVKSGFLIQSESEVAQVNNMTVFEGYLAKDDPKIDVFQTYLTSIFMLMVANDDYDFLSNRNVCILEGDKYYPIPYDFDFSGFVNAHYSIPNPNIPSHRLRDRVVMYEYNNQETLDAVIDHIASKEEEITSKIESAEYLTKSSRKDLKKYISGFIKYLTKKRELPFHEVIPYR